MDANDLKLRRHALALSLLLFNDKFLDDLFNYPDPSAVGNGHIFKKIDAGVYKNLYAYFTGMGRSQANDVIYDVAETMMDWANAALAPQASEVDQKIQLDGGYSDPNQCPCLDGDYADCPVVDPLLQ